MPPIHEVGDLLSRLYHLRDRVAADIARLENMREQRRNGTTPTPKPPKLTTQPRPIPDRLIRAWARGQHIPVPPTGRISATLRQQYLQQHQPNTKASNR